MSYNEFSSCGRYIIYEGSTRKEALDKVWLDAIQNGRKEDTVLIKVDQEVKKSFFGLKKKSVWKALAFVKDSHIKKSSFKNKKNITESEDLFSQSNYTKKDSQLKEGDLNKPVLTNNINDKTFSSLPLFINKYNEINKELFESMKKYFDNKFCEIKSELFKNELIDEIDNEKKEAIIKEKELAKKNLKWLEEFQRIKDIDSVIINDIIDDITKNTNKELLLNKKEIISYVKNFIRSRIVIDNISLENYNYPRNILFVGPTGVGKTVSIVKLAAHLAKLRNKTMRFISIDRYKVGADAQLSYYTDLMDCKFYPINKEEDFYKLLDNNETYYTFIDMAGKSPKDSIVIKELKEWLLKSGKKFDIHLVVSSTTKLSDLDLVMEGYSILDINHILATKLDESKWFGSIISLLYKSKKPLSFITNGQAIPSDFEIGNVDKLITETLDYKEE